MSVLLDTEVKTRGITYYLYTAEYQVDDTRMSLYFHALSHEHAEYLLAAIGSTAKVAGQVLEFVDAGDDLRAPITIN